MDHPDGSIFFSGSDRSRTVPDRRTVVLFDRKTVRIVRDCQISLKNVLFYAPMVPEKNIHMAKYHSSRRVLAGPNASRPLRLMDLRPLTMVFVSPDRPNSPKSERSGSLDGPLNCLRATFQFRHFLGKGYHVDLFLKTH